MKIVLLVTLSLIFIFKSESATRGSTELAYEGDFLNFLEMLPEQKQWKRAFSIHLITGILN